jgi:hypothetical protein
VIWERSWRADPRARILADRHYNRQRVGADQFVPPGRCLVLRTSTADAFWVTSWPLPEFTKHAWAGAWMCSAFRNEGPCRASDLIRQAVAATRWRYGAPPPLGMVTFVDERKVRPTKVRGRDVYGWTFRKAGFREVGRTKEENLLALQLLPDDMPAPAAPLGTSLFLALGAA